MKSSDGSYSSVLSTRTTFLQQHGVTPESTVLVHLTYQSDNYRRYVTADDSLRGDGITRTPSFEADAVATATPGLVLFLPLADCVGAVMYDTMQNILMVSHLGRHNLEQHGGTASVAYMAAQFGCNPAHLNVWLSPAAGASNYPLYVFENRSMHDVAQEQLVAAGVRAANIEHSPIDVTIDKNYFSHSQFLRGNRGTDGRFAIAAWLNEDAN